MKDLKDRIFILWTDDQSAEISQFKYYRVATYLRLSEEDYHRRVERGLETVSTVAEMLANEFYVPSVKGNRSIVDCERLP
jgi:hypothetical protein